MKYPIAFCLLGLGFSAGCAARDATGTTSPDGTSRFVASASQHDESAARSGDLVVEKNCQSFTGKAGDFCTITASNLKAIPVGSVITYKSAAVGGILDTDITLDPPGPGNNAVAGHCFVDLTTGLGTCSLSGGTGRYRGLHASVAVTPLGWPNFEWNGTYYYDN